MSTGGRTRNYATVIYPESAPDNFISLIRDSCIGGFLSPLHCYDTNPDGSPKKPHYHLLLMFSSVKTKQQAQLILESFGGVGCECVNSSRGYARYLCHLDNPDKYQYKVDDVLSFAGSDYLDVINLPTDKYGCISDMIQFCLDNDIIYYCDLLRYCMEFNEQWFRVLCDSGTYVMKEFLKSSGYQRKQLDYTPEN